MIKRISLKVKKTDESFLIHDTRQDVRSLAGACNFLIDKVNELVDEVNRLKAEAVQREAQP